MKKELVSTTLADARSNWQVRQKWKVDLSVRSLLVHNLKNNYQKIIIFPLMNKATIMPPLPPVLWYKLVHLGKTEIFPRGIWLTSLGVPRAWTGLGRWMRGPPGVDLKCID